MNSVNLRIVCGTVILTILVCAGIFVYAQWDLKRFNESLGELSTVDTTLKVPEKNVIATQDTPQPVPTMDESKAISNHQVFEAEPRLSEPDSVESSAFSSDAEEVPSTSPDDYLSLFWEETEADALETEVTYNQEKVKAGFEDYNAYLTSDPDYAYRRLEEALREQHDDSPDVTILVQNVRRGNNGTMTIDDAIETAEASLRLMSKLSSPKAAQSVVDFLETLRETKLLALEQGVNIEFEGGFFIGE